MFKISKVEKWMLAVTAAIVLLTAGYFIIDNAGREKFSIQGQTIWTTEVAASVQDMPTEGRININTADAELLQTLPKIGPTLAKRIVEYRQENGEFRIPEDIARVSGIGRGILAEIEDYITVG